MSDITLGIIGSGQLGSLLCQAAKKLNVKTVVISDDEQGPAQNYSNEFIFSKYDDETKIKELELKPCAIQRATSLEKQHYLHLIQ